MCNFGAFLLLQQQEKKVAKLIAKIIILYGFQKLRLALLNSNFGEPAAAASAAAAGASSAAGEKGS